MPLVKGAKASTRKGFSENVKREIDSGKPKNQALAIAYSEAEKGRKQKKHSDIKEDKKLVKSMVKKTALKGKSGK